MIFKKENIFKPGDLVRIILSSSQKSWLHSNPSFIKRIENLNYVLLYQDEGERLGDNEKFRMHGYVVYGKGFDPFSHTISNECNIIFYESHAYQFEKIT
jgi:hypothetical protein